MLGCLDPQPDRVTIDAHDGHDHRITDLNPLERLA
jgi:hypothetical protein